MGTSSLIEYLKDPYLVARIQKYFGVSVKEPVKGRKIFDRHSGSGGVKAKTAVSNYSNISGESNSSSCRIRSSSDVDNGIGEEEQEVTLNKNNCTENPGEKDFDLRQWNERYDKENKSVELNRAEEDSSGVSSGTGSISGSSGSSGGNSCSSGSCNENEEEDDEDDLVNRVVGNKFWYYLFLFGTGLGDEIFYASFFSFWFWNIDGAVGRRVVLVWALCMYIGQGLKDIIRWPRPAVPPVIRLEKKWQLEYGMPSTHAIVAASVPFSIIIFTSCRYQYPFALGVSVALLWCALVCVSRIYLGMHTVLDIIAGLLLVAALFPVMIPLVDWLDPIFLKHPLGALFLLAGGAILAVFSPGGDRWTPARGDTMVILGSACGLISGAWVNFQMGIIHATPLNPPFPVIWPSIGMLGMSMIRLAIGLCIVVATRAIAKSVLYATLKSLVYSQDISYFSKATRKELIVELSYKFVRYVSIGFNVVFLAPYVFRLMGIERPTFHTEV